MHRPTPKLPYPVQSQMLRSLDYDFASGSLLAEYTNGHIYRYENVPHALFDLLLAVQTTQNTPYRVSLGHTFDFTIRRHPETYPYKRLTEEDGEARLSNLPATSPSQARLEASRSPSPFSLAAPESES